MGSYEQPAPAELRSNAVRVAVKAPYSRTLFDLACEQAVRFADAPAVVSAGRALSYAELAERARRVAAALSGRGVRHHDRIGLLISNRIEWVELCLGAAGAGAVAVPLSTWSTRNELEFLLADSGMTMLFALARSGDRDYAKDLAALLPELAEGRSSERFPLLREVVLIAGADGDAFTPLEAFLEGQEPGADLPPGNAASAVDDGLILYTSGSSAKPKAVRLRQHGIVENGFNIGERQGYTSDDKVLIASPLFWSFGSANALSAVLTHGATAVLQERFEPKEALDLIERHGCTALYTLPSMTSALLRCPTFEPARVATLRTGLTIGSAQDVQDAAEKLGIREICNVYGATETYGNCSVTWHHWPLERRMNCQGEPLPGNEFRFIDPETGDPAPPGQGGLVEVRGYVMPGYSGFSAVHNESTLTADGFYRTGDIGRLDENGAFVFVGRSTEMIKRAGINISPAEVEEVLSSHPGVEHVAVVGVPDSERGERVIAYVVAREATPPTQEELISHCRAIASKYKVPDFIELTSALPTTATGKLQRRELKRIATERYAVTENG